MYACLFAQVPLQQLLPFESHRQEAVTQLLAKPHPPRSRNNSSLSDVDDRPLSPSSLLGGGANGNGMGGSRSVTPYLSEGSALPSPHGGKEDSFQLFMLRMVHQYMKEEEVRAKHHTTLLQLREKALREKTKVRGHHNYSLFSFLLWCVVVLSLSSRCFVIVLLLMCRCFVVVLLFCYFVIVLLLFCCFFCRCFVVILSLFCRCFVVVLLLFCHCFVVYWVCSFHLF